MSEHECLHENEFKELAVSIVELKGDIKQMVARINGSLDKMQGHMDDARGWRMLTASIGATLIIACVGWTIWAMSVSRTYGQLEKQVYVNTDRLFVLETNYAKLKDTFYDHQDDLRKMKIGG